MRILLVKTTSMGDVIHNLPVASDIRRQFHDAQIDWVVEESFAEIPRLHPAIRHVLPVAVRRWRKQPFNPATWREMGAYRRAVSTDRYDLILDTQCLLKSALLARQAHGPICGLSADMAREPISARFYDRRFAIPKSLNAVVRNRQLAAAALGYASETLPLDYGIPARPLVADWLPATDYAVLLTATSRTDKEWAERNWIELAACLKSAGLTCVLPAGSPAERLRAERLVTAMGQAVTAPPLGLTELAGLLAGARLVIGVDTGLVHLAAALAKPTIALYCGSDPGLTGVLGVAPFANLGKPGMAPTVAEVTAATQGMLG